MRIIICMPILILLLFYNFRAIFYHCNTVVHKPNIMNGLRAAIRGACCVYDELPNAEASTVGGDGIRSFYTHSANTIHINPKLPDGARASYVAIGDICFAMTSDSDFRRSVHVHTQMHLDSESGNINIAYTLDADDGTALKEVRVRVHVCGVLLVDIIVVRKPFSGRTIQHTLLRQAGCNMSICPSGAYMAFSSYRRHCVNVFALPDFQFVGKLGEKGTGPTELNAPRGLCFTDAGTLLIADCCNNRVQHWTLDGKWIASYSVAQPWCVAAHGDVIAVGCYSTSGVRMFSLKNSAVARAWMNGGRITVIAFVDAVTLVIANNDEKIDLYTLEGMLKARLTTNIISVGLAVSDGCLLVSDYRQKRIRAFSLTGDELSESPLSAYSLQIQPLSIALHAERAYVFLEDVDSENDDYEDEPSRVCVFE